MSKKNNKEKFIVIGVAISACLLLFIYIFSTFSNGDENSSSTQVVISDTGEASSINFEMPSIKNIEDDSISLLKKYEQYKRDSINKASIENSSLNNIFKKGNKQNSSLNSRLKGKNDDAFLSEIEKEIEESPKKTIKKKKLRVRSYRKPKRKIENKTIDTTVVKATVKKLSPKERMLLARKKNKNNTTSEKTANTISKSVTGVVDPEQQVRNGGDVRIRLTQDLKLEEIIIPARSHVMGRVSFSNNGRVMIRIESIVYNNVPYSVDYTIYDGKGGEGLSVGVENLNSAITDGATNEAESEIYDTGRLGRLISGIFRNNKRNLIVTLNDEHPLFLKSK